MRCKFLHHLLKALVSYPKIPCYFCFILITCFNETYCLLFKFFGITRLWFFHDPSFVEYIRFLSSNSTKTGEAHLSFAIFEGSRSFDTSLSHLHLFSTSLPLIDLRSFPLTQILDFH